jgi:uncharacterized protein (TIGR02996 family)
MARRKQTPVPAVPAEVLPFLTAIREDPEDDTPRLVLADWLMEHGGRAESARGEFLRARVLLSRMEEDDPQRPPLERRAEALQDRHERA